MKYALKRRLVTGFSIFLLALVIILRNRWFALNTLSIFLSIWIFYLVDHSFKIKFEFRHYLYILAILVFGVLLSPLYHFSISYDKILHLVMPIFVSLLAFFMVDKIKINLKSKLIITICIAFSALAFFEIIEYLLDVFWNLKLQGVYIRDAAGFTKGTIIMNKNTDTMIDLLLDLGGCFIFAISKIISNKFKKLTK